MPPDPFLSRLAAAADRLIPAGAEVLVGVSGGPDSTALLHGLTALGVAVRAAHLNHRLRPGADADEQAVRDAAASLGVPLAVESADVRAAAGAAGESIETAGRRLRLEFLARTAEAAGCRAVAVAHTADDHAETVLHRLARGTGLRGLAGIPESRPIMRGAAVRLVRPLLGVRKAEILAWLADRGLSYRTDPTNASADFTRNRIRHEVLPLLARTVNPEIVPALLRLARLAGWAADHLEAEAAEALARCWVAADADRLALSAERLAGLPAILRLETLRAALRSLSAAEGELGLEHLLRTAELIDAPGARQLPGGVAAVRRGGTLRLERTAADVPPAAAPPEIPLPVAGSAAWAGGTVTAERLSGGLPELRSARAGNGAVSELLDADAVAPPLVIRPPRPGERFAPLGAAYDKSVAGFMKDAGRPAGERAGSVVVADAAGVLWVVPLRLDRRAAVTAFTRTLLRLTYLPPA
jgi:tRNA(Ile)-lysidine synthase